MHDPGKRLTTLTAKEIQTLYGLPQFIDEERDVYVALDPLEKQRLAQFRSITSSVYFILQLGYFKAKKQFYIFGLHEVSDDVVHILHRYFPDVTKLPAVVISLDDWSGAVLAEYQPRCGPDANGKLWLG